MDTSTATAICCLSPLAIVTIGYIALSKFKPFKHCRKCKGAGRQRLMLGRTRFCHRCKGTGHVLRLGFRISNHLTRLGSEFGKGRS